MKEALKAQDALLLDAALESIPYGFCVWSNAFKLVLWNRRYLDIYGFPSHRIRKGASLASVVKLSCDLGNHPGQDTDDLLAAYKANLLANRSGARAKLRERLAGERWVETVHAYTPGLGWMVTHEDVTDEVAASELAQHRGRDLEQQNLRLDAAVNNISQGLCMFDADGRLVICNERYGSIYGLPEHLVAQGTRFDDILGHLFDHKGMRSEAGETRDAYIRRRWQQIAAGSHNKVVVELDGRTILVQLHPMSDGGWVSTHEDITERQQQEARIRHLALHDALTELPNRTRFVEELQELEATLARGERAAVLHVDLDHFKAVNDAHGHAIGDSTLKQASARLWGATRETDLLSRLGADNFGLLLRPVEQPADAAAVAERIVGALGNPFMISGQQIVTGASVGIAMAPEDGETADTLMKNAEMACLRAKKEGRATFQFFEPGMDAAIRARLDVEQGLRGALERRELRLEFQPLIDLKRDRIAAMEALLRWNAPGRGVVSPAEFIPIAEETGLIVPIGEWVLNEACRAAAAWPTRARVSVNLSPVQFRRGRLDETVMAALERWGLAPTRLELEITESLLLAENAQTLQTLHKLRQRGVRVALDDFGTGYASLSYLRAFPFDKIKIDRSFVRGLGRADGLAILKAVTGLGHSLGMAVTAEGVETEEQLATVRAENCDEVQGYLFSRPLRPEAAAELLAAEIRQRKPGLKRVS